MEMKTRWMAIYAAKLQVLTGCDVDAARQSAETAYEKDGETDPEEAARVEAGYWAEEGE